MSTECLKAFCICCLTRNTLPISVDSLEFVPDQPEATALVFNVHDIRIRGHFMITILQWLQFDIVLLPK